MKIRRDEIDGEEVIITPCSECLFYSAVPKPSCMLGRIEKYEALGKTKNTPQGVEIKTFCNHARPDTWQKMEDSIQDCIVRVKNDNKIKYDLIARISTPKDVLKLHGFMKRATPPQRIIISIEEIDIAEVVDLASELGVSFELIQIKDLEARVNRELDRVSAPWSETVDLSKKYSLDLISQLEHKINDNLEQIVAVIGDQYILMSMLMATFDTIGLYFSFENIEENATMQDTTENIRRFDGERICHYS